MNHRLHASVVFLAITIALPVIAQQAPRVAHIGYVYPAGGQQGTTFRVTVGGQYLDGVSEARISGDGAKAVVVEHVKPMSQQQASRLRDQLKELQGKRRAALGVATGADAAQPSTQPAWTTNDDKLFADIKQKLSTFVRKPSSPAIAEMAIVEVTIDPAADPGARDLRLRTRSGFTNPLTFHIGRLPEFSENATKVSREPTKSVATDEMTVTLPATIDGQVMAGGVDRCKFHARKGQHLVVVASARQLIPYIPDAVPGWFQATLTLTDAKGDELAYADDFRFDPDPAFHYLIPNDGEYCIEIKDAIYRGREDFVYRITAGELPWITSIFPLGGKAGEAARVNLKGWNLPAAHVVHEASEQLPGITAICVGTAGRQSNSKPFQISTWSECLEIEPNDLPRAAQAAALPIVVNGRIGQAGDVDVFSFDGRANEHIVAEVYARRLDSPLDSFLELTDSAGKRVAFNDDQEDKGAGLTTHHADSYLTARLPADGVYYLHVSDAQHKGGTEYAYRLRISPPQHDFELRIVPSSINLDTGGTAAITAYALRRDGFDGDITLQLKNDPVGFRLNGATIPAGQDHVRFTMTAPPNAADAPLDAKFEGRALVSGRDITRDAVPADDMMQAFSYRHLVAATELLVTVSPRNLSRNIVRFIDTPAVHIAPGGETQIHAAVANRPFVERVELELNQPPPGITIANTTHTGEGRLLITLRCDAELSKVGVKGNLIFEVFAVRRAPASNSARKDNARRMSLGVLPAVPFEVRQDTGSKEAENAK